MAYHQSILSDRISYADDAEMLVEARESYFQEFAEYRAIEELGFGYHDAIRVALNQNGLSDEMVDEVLSEALSHIPVELQERWLRKVFSKAGRFLKKHARKIGTVAGGAIGGVIGGPAGAQIGQRVGGALGGAISNVKSKPSPQQNVPKQIAQGTLNDPTLRALLMQILQGGRISRENLGYMSDTFAEAAAYDERYALPPHEVLVDDMLALGS